MKAVRASVWDLYNGAKQYVVPLFQRPYVWHNDQWEQLWMDIGEQYFVRVKHPKGRYPSRFLGSVVVVREYEKNLDKFTIIDGQQRITTISIILAVIRAFARERGLSELYEQISDFLRNTPKSGEGQYVVIPTRVDKQALYNILDENYVFEQDSKIVECFDYFWRIIDLSPELDLNILQQVITEDLCLVYIELDEGENPNQVFEALNYRGVPLEESDLIRNFFFANLETPEIAEAQYDQFWKPMEERLNNDQEIISRFLRHFSMRTGYLIRTGEIFENIRQRYAGSSPDEIRLLLRDINRYSDYYCQIWFPEEGRNDDSVNERIRRSLIRIRLLGPDAVSPFLMVCLAAHDGMRNKTKDLSDENLCRILVIIETYLIRRAVCNRPDSGYPEVFSELCGRVAESGVLSPEMVRLYLHSLDEPLSFPDDDEFEDHLRHADMYHPKSDNTLIWIILQSLEDLFVDQSRRTDRMSGIDLFDDESRTRMIDHIMPENLNEWWQNHLGPDVEFVHQDYLNRLGNLTLTLENSVIKNADFEMKKSWYALDNMMLNNSMKSIRLWRRFQIDQRSGILAAFCLKLWPKSSEPGPENEEKEIFPCLRQGDIPKNLKPQQVTIQGTSYPVRFWYQVLEQTVQVIYHREPHKFERIVREYQGYFSEDSTRFKSIIGQYSFKSRFGRYQVRDMCLNMIRLIGWHEDVWCLTCE